MIAATAIERITGKSTMSSVANAAATVVPEAATVRPAVRMVLMSATPRSETAHFIDEPANHDEGIVHA